MLIISSRTSGYPFAGCLQDQKRLALILMLFLITFAETFFGHTRRLLRGCKANTPKTPLPE